MKNYLNEWAERYRTDLTENIMPFWLKHGLDHVNGGIYTCVDRDGSLIDTTKSVWFQGRFAFVASFAYNTIEKNPGICMATAIGGSCINTGLRAPSSVFNRTNRRKSRRAVREAGLW